MSALPFVNEIEGNDILAEYQKSFDELFLELTKSSSQEESKEFLQNMLRVLSVSEDNLKKISNEKWFQRVWYGITRKNKKLRDMNQQNLLTVQKMSAVFLENYAQNNQILTVAMKEALLHLSQSDIEDAKIKKYMLEWTKRNNARNRIIEERLNKLECKLGVRKKPTLLQILFHWNRKNGNIEDVEPSFIEDSISKSNSEIREAVRANLFIYLEDNISDSSWNCLNFVGKACDEYDRLTDKIDLSKPEQKIKPQEYAQALDNLLKYVPFTLKTPESSIISTVNENFDIIQDLLMAIINAYIPLSSTKLITTLPYSDRTKVSERCIKQIDEYAMLIDDFFKQREVVLNLFPRINKFLNRSDAETILRGVFERAIPVWGQIRFVDDLFFGGKFKESTAKVFGLKTDNDYLDEFFNELGKMFEKFDTLRDQSIPMIYNKVDNECTGYLKSMFYNFDAIFDDFTTYSVDLNQLNNELVEYLNKKSEKEENVS